MVVMASCKNCGREFKLTAVQIESEQDLKSSTFANLSENCPHCGAMNMYSEQNTIWREG
jgi:transposase-like protein